jgi:hypothetical protein
MLQTDDIFDGFELEDTANDDSDLFAGFEMETTTRRKRGKSTAKKVREIDGKLCVIHKGEYVEIDEESLSPVGHHIIYSRAGKKDEYREKIEQAHKNRMAIHSVNRMYIHLNALPEDWEMKKKPNPITKPEMVKYWVSVRPGVKVHGRIVDNKFSITKILKR